MTVEPRSLCVILKFTDVRCIVHSFCCEATKETVRLFLVNKFLTKLILEIIQPRTEARKSDIFLACITGIKSLPMECSVFLNKC